MRAPAPARARPTLHPDNGVREAREIVFRNGGRGSGRTFYMITSIDPDVPTVIVTHDPGVGRYIGDLIKVHRPEINYTDYGSGKTKIITVKRDEDLRLLRGWSGAVKVDHAVLDNIDRRVLGLLEAVCEKVAVEKADRDRARQGR